MRPTLKFFTELFFQQSSIIYLEIYANSKGISKGNLLQSKEIPGADFFFTQFAVTLRTINPFFGIKPTSKNVSVASGVRFFGDRLEMQDVPNYFKISETFKQK